MQKNNACDFSQALFSHTHQSVCFIEYSKHPYDNLSLIGCFLFVFFSFKA